MSTSPTPSNWVAELRKLVNDAFDMNDLHSLCLDLEQEALFSFVQPDAWAKDIWRFTINTGKTEELILLDGWEFAFDSVSQ